MRFPTSDQIGALTDVVIRLLDIMTDGPVIAVLFFLVFRKPIARFITRFFDEQLPELVKQLSKVKLGSLEAEFATVQSNINSHSRALAEQIEERVSLRDVEVGEGDDVDDIAMSESDSIEDWTGEQAEEIDDGSAEASNDGRDEYAAAIAALRG